ncbi:alpha-ketoglutarate-dependent dioxygenase AlkB family protein [Dyadobacter psychrotolerans]|uniref:Alpha-ketoglutarate-dependent dioxygenase AlkB n=1 Tax=Dyadobacter psychrotolerans TaxID=2541721 RepID=A0A4R5DH85_9BACT|nr:alpha-ketoglutarate-dependent dioxygenase AlkB [Dyadobacter psychrotolerans]TDE11280.1 alpha-ketoglutarate-dependent dioxygenase AlkB [Dyadobacter psychrotolerans]
MEQLSLFGANESLRFPEELLEFYPQFLDTKQCMDLLKVLIEEVPWRQQIIQMYGKPVVTPRLTAWYGDTNRTYRFSGTKFDPVPWTDSLLHLKKEIETLTKLEFNSVLLNYYRDGNDSVAWHADNERELGTRPHIASLSIGQARDFEFRRKADHSGKYALRLNNGSLLIMKGDLQHHWEHRIPKSKKDIAERINMTFRLIRE